MATSAKSALCNEETTTANLATPVAPLNPKEVPIMLTTATQQMNEGETRALYAKLGSLSDPTWRMVGSVTPHGCGRAGGIPARGRRPSARCGRHVSAGTALLSRISCAWSSAWRVTVVASTRSPVASSRPRHAEKCAGWPSRTRVLRWLRLCHEAAPCGPAHLRHQLSELDGE